MHMETSTAFEDLAFALKGQARILAATGLADEASVLAAQAERIDAALAEKRVWRDRDAVLCITPAHSALPGESRA